MLNVYAVNVNQDMNRLMYNHFMTFLSEDKRERINKYHKIDDAKRTLMADILVRTIICANLEIKNKDIYFDKNQYGKPFLRHFKDFHFNVSHSGQWVICAAHHLPVGIDVEHIKPVDFDIAKRFFTEDEYSDLLNMDSSLRLPYFYELWTLKESYIKAVGKGLSIPLDSFSFKIHDCNIVLKTNNVLKNCYFKQFSVNSNYKLAVCSMINDFSDNLIFRSFDEIFDATLLI